MRVILLAILCMVAGSVSAEPPGTFGGLGKYRDYTCSQLAQEARNVSLKVVGLSGKKAADRLSEVTTGPEKTSVIWPEELKASGTLTSGEAVLIREQMFTIEEASIQGQCSIEFRRSTDK
jgi:hypothetical protein